ncbi:MAG: hypothetical protein ABR985_15425 [Methanotrichaceae archaeon]
MSSRRLPTSSGGEESERLLICVQRLCLDLVDFWIDRFDACTIERLAILEIDAGCRTRAICQAQPWIYRIFPGGQAIGQAEWGTVDAEMWGMLRESWKCV